MLKVVANFAKFVVFSQHRKLDVILRENAILRHEIEKLKSTLNATIILFENRVDAVYRALVQERFREIGAHIDIQPKQEIEAQIQKLISAGLQTEVDLDALKMQDILSNEITPGKVSGPLTLYGFRLNRLIAQEHGNFTEVGPGKKKIAIHGPYKRLKPGHYVAQFEIELKEDRKAENLRSGEIIIDIYRKKNDTIVTSKSFNLTGSNSLIAALDFHWEPELSLGDFVFRLSQNSDVNLLVKCFELKMASNTGKDT